MERLALPQINSTTGQPVDWDNPHWTNPDNWVVSMDDHYHYIKCYESLTKQQHPYTRSREIDFLSIYKESYKESIKPVKEVDNFFKKVYKIGSLPLALWILISSSNPTTSSSMLLMTLIKVGGPAVLSHIIARMGATQVWNRCLKDVMPVNMGKIDPNIFNQKLAEAREKIGPNVKLEQHIIQKYGGYEAWSKHQQQKIDKKIEKHGQEYLESDDYKKIKEKLDRCKV
jgi:hypothetical protein